MPFDQWDATHDDARDVRKPTGSASDDDSDAAGGAATSGETSSTTAQTHNGVDPARPRSVTASGGAAPGTAASAESPSSTSADAASTKKDAAAASERSQEDVHGERAARREREGRDGFERGLIDALMHDIEQRIDALGDRLLGRIDAAVDDMEHRIDDALDELDAAYARDGTPEINGGAPARPGLDGAQQVAAMTTDEALALATDHPGDVALLNRIHETMEAVAMEYLGDSTAWLHLRNRFLDGANAADAVFADAADASVPDAVRDNVVEVLNLYVRVAPDVRAAYTYLRTHEPDLNLEVLGALDVDWMASPPVRVADPTPAGAPS